MSSVKLTFDKANGIDIKQHLHKCASLFIPNLESYVNIDEYSNKIASLASTIEIWEKERLVGLLAYYKNEIEKTLFISNISLESSFIGKGYGNKMIEILESKLYENSKFQKIVLKVHKENTEAISFYERLGFIILDSSKEFLELSK